MKCPDCKKEIEYLHNVYSIYRMVGCEYFSPDDCLLYATTPVKEWNNDREEQSWDCPECDAELFYDEDEALEFLKGGETK